MVKGTGRLSQSPFQASVMMPLAIERTFVTCKVQNLLADFWINPFLPRAAKSRHFVILLNQSNQSQPCIQTTLM